MPLWKPQLATVAGSNKATMQRVLILGCVDRRRFPCAYEFTGTPVSCPACLRMVEQLVHTRSALGHCVPNVFSCPAVIMWSCCMLAAGHMWEALLEVH